MIPLRADPDRGVLIGWVLLLTLLFPPTLLLVLIVAAWLDYKARKRRDHRRAQLDAEFADRFQELEAGILDRAEQSETQPRPE
jgi:hypothetical protein